MRLDLGASQEISRVKAYGEPLPASQQMAPQVLTHSVQQPLRSRLSRGSRIYSRKQVTACVADAHAHRAGSDSGERYRSVLVRKEKSTPFGVNVTRSQVLYRAAQEGLVTYLRHSWAGSLML